jgi:hypothetical protein
LLGAHARHQDFHPGGRQQREGQVAVRDRAAGRALPGRAFDIDVNPLTVFGAVRELVDAPLADFDPR